MSEGTPGKAFALETPDFKQTDSFIYTLERLRQL